MSEIDEPILMETGGKDGISIEECLAQIHTRTNTEVERAWVWLNNMKPEPTTKRIVDYLQRFAAKGWSTEQIYSHILGFMNPGLRNIPSPAHEFMALAIERAVRKHWKQL